MNQDEIIAMAREAGAGLSSIAEPLEHPWKLSQDELERFAALVAAKEREAWRNALQPVFQTRMGAEQVREAVQAALRQRGAA